MMLTERPCTSNHCNPDAEITNSCVQGEKCRMCADRVWAGNEDKTDATPQRMKPYIVLSVEGSRIPLYATPFAPTLQHCHNFPHRIKCVSIDYGTNVTVTQTQPKTYLVEAASLAARDYPYLHLVLNDSHFPMLRLLRPWKQRPVSHR
jgi:hypothetical protein